MCMESDIRSWRLELHGLIPFSTVPNPKICSTSGNNCKFCLWNCFNRTLQLHKSTLFQTLSRLLVERSEEEPTNAKRGRPPCHQYRQLSPVGVSGWTTDNGTVCSERNEIEIEEKGDRYVANLLLKHLKISSNFCMADKIHPDTGLALEVVSTSLPLPL